MQLIYAVLEINNTNGHTQQNRGIIITENDIEKLVLQKYDEQYGMTKDKFPQGGDRYEYKVWPYQGEYTEANFGTFGSYEDRD